MSCEFCENRKVFRSSLILEFIGFHQFSIVDADASFVVFKTVIVQMIVEIKARTAYFIISTMKIADAVHIAYERRDISVIIFLKLLFRFLLSRQCFNLTTEFNARKPYFPSLNVH